MSLEEECWKQMDLSGPKNSFYLEDASLHETRLQEACHICKLRFSEDYNEQLSLTMKRLST